MKKLSLKFDYLTVIKYLSFFILCFLFNNLESQAFPYATAVLSASLMLNSSVILSPLLYLLSIILSKQYGILVQCLFAGIVLSVTKFIYDKCKTTPKLEFIIFSALSLSLFLIVPDKTQQVIIEKRILVCIISTMLSLFLYLSLNAVSKKGLKLKFYNYEQLSLFISVVAFGLCLSNTVSPLFWKGLSFFIILMSCYLFRFSLGALISAMLGITLSIYYGNINYISFYLILGFTADCFMGISRYLSSISIIIVDYVLELLFCVYGGYTVFDFIPALIGVLLFSALPNKPLSDFKDKLYAFREKQLTRKTINNNRLMLSNKLYELSTVFNEMAEAFNKLKQNSVDEEKAKQTVLEELVLSICKNCESKNSCSKVEITNCFYKLLDIGFAKGKVSLIDIPTSMIHSCSHQNDIIFASNKMIAEYRSLVLSYENLKVGRTLISDEVHGISEILRTLALDSGTQLKYQSRLERNLSAELSKNGLNASELLIYGEDKRTTVSLILSNPEFSIELITNIVSKVIGVKFSLTEKANITEDKIYLSFKIASQYDAVFGIAKATKDGSESSGDTHAISRIEDSKFLVALSDGMGSGKNAENISSVSISLIESFYKSGMKSSLILNTVNKLLSVNSEDNFTALDISVIDLNSCSADFIKYGSPYGFIISDNRIKIVEGNSLPLGILSELKPSVCSATLQDGDIIVLTTDGISDSFGSSQEIIDFIRSVPCKNPQSLCNQILEKAISLKNRKADDMTVLAVRIFKKPA